MRIAYLTQTYPPMISGAAIIAEKLAHAIIERGHQTLVITASDRGIPSHIQNGNLSLHRLHSHRNPMRVHSRFLLYPRKDILCALKNFNPEIIHSHDALMMGSLGIDYAHQRNIPIALTIHQLPWFVASYMPEIAIIRGGVENVLWKYAQRKLHQFSWIITPSPKISAIVASKTGLIPNTISNGICLQTFHPHLESCDEQDMRKKLNIPLDVPIILHVGRLDVDKKVDRVILAASQAMQQTKAHLLIVGDGTKKSALIQMCKTLGIRERSHFPGYISVQEGLAKIYRMAYLLITASEIEVQSLVLLEALASGLPIVAVRAPSIPDIVQDGVNGYLAEPGDLQSLGRATIAILNNPELAQMMGRASRNFAVKHQFKYTVDAYEALYYQLTS